MDPRWQAALAFTDHFLTAPGPLPPDLVETLAGHFAEDDLTELGLGLGLFHGFSKMLMALGLEPDDMDSTVLPTPAPTNPVAASLDPTDPHTALLHARPDLAGPWDVMRSALEELPDLPDQAREAARWRLAQLYQVSNAPRPVTEPTAADPLVALVTECAELFAIDIRALTSGHLDRVTELTGPGGAVQLVMTLAVYDGIYRYWATLGAAA